MADVSDELAAGEQYLARLDYDTAYKHFDKASRTDPSNAAAYFGKAESALGIPKIEADTIVGLYKKAIELDPQNPQFLDAFASFCIDLGRFNDAEQAYLKAAQLDPDNAAFYYMDFAVNYNQKAPQIFEGRVALDDKTRDIIKHKALDYALKALGMEKGDAKRLLS